ncbi:MAG: hypothetical protein ACHP7P_07910 [Terriglobales bacterium]
MPKQHTHKPLRRFDYALVSERLDGLLINVDRDLQRMTAKAEQVSNRSAVRCLSLLNVMIRFATNSYHAVRYITADTPEDHNRRPNYVLVVPTINRQLLDLLFSLVYMFDDFECRSLQYQRAGWREATEEYQKFKSQFSGQPEWRQHFRNVKQALEQMIVLFGITTEERKNPKLIPYWKHPFELKDEPTQSRSFLRYLDKWLYGDTSAQAHLSFGGLFMVGLFLVADIVGGQGQELVKNRIIHQYRFQHISRTAVATLAIATEIDAHYRLGNKEAINYLWTIFADHSAEAKEMLEQRYEKLVWSSYA